MNNKKNQKEMDCNSMRDELEIEAEGMEPHFFGSGNVLLNEGLSQVFKSTPLTT